MARGINYGYDPGPAPQQTQSTGALRSTLVKPSATPSMADLIGQQPLPPDLTDYLKQQQAMIDAQMKQIQGYGAGVTAQMQQLNRMYGADPTAQYRAQLMAMMQQDPLAAYRQQLAEMYAQRPQGSQAVYLYGY